MAARKRTAKPKPVPCGPCNGTGQTTETVYAGRGARRRPVAEQEATCLDCLGTGATPA
ncbi:hypothetical protein [Streptomyces sp. NRRL WC-3742]|uniref:hypothetical protein n=1 Tax=Streptomyces sp. NRRL WC-3742 TaxID=1463934 RepID=UPI000A4E434A|nr:hypothetical protein [Streptomyces sp. NRRL WC-3742]